MRHRRDKLSLAGAMGEMRSDYNAARSSRYRRRRTGLASAGSGADYHYASENDFLRVMEYARDFDRNDMVVGQITDRAVTNTVQNGMALAPQTGDEGADREIKARWDEWSNDPDRCDVMGEHTFGDMEYFALRHTLVDGDLVALPLRSGHLQLVEGHRIRTPGNTKRNVVHGVLLEEAPRPRKRVEYWITKDDIQPHQAVSKVSEVKRYPVRDEEGHRQLFHVYNPKRVSQTRGVTAYAPIFDAIGMHDDAQFAALVKQQVAACFAIFRERGPDYDPGADYQRGERTSDTLGDGSTRRIEGIAPGMEIQGEVGEKLQGFSPNVPGEGFFPHVKLILTFIGINLGMPLVLVLLDASETNFSGFRGAVDQARMGFRRNQTWLIRRLHCPTYRWKVRQWMAEDAFLRAASKRSGVDLMRHLWNPPTWPYIEPLKDAGTALLRMRNGLTSPRRLHAEHGDDHQQIIRETIADNGFAIIRAKRQAARINKRFADDGQPVHWRELLSLPTPDGVKVSLDTADPSIKPAKEAKDAA